MVTFGELNGEPTIDVATSQTLGTSSGTLPLAPDEYLQRPNTLQLGVSGHRPRDWRYVTVYVEVPSSAGGRLVERDLDLSERSIERQVLELLAARGTATVHWINEGVTTRCTFSDLSRSLWQEVLRNTRGISPEDWAQELDLHHWRALQASELGDRPRAPRRRVMAAPSPPIPSFAPRSGAVPQSGSPRLAGIALPAGVRLPERPATYWATEDAIDNAADLARQLASVFPDTGVWPLLWRDEEDPDSYMPGGGDSRAVEGVDAAAVLTEGWTTLKTGPLEVRDPFVEFPGLAGPSEVTSARNGSDSFAAALPGSARLLLVPCNRPADAITILGGLSTEHDPSHLSAVLRSWEERFAAVAIEVGPSWLALGVSAPPTNTDQALQVAAEHFAFALPPDWDPAQTIRALAAALQTVAGRSGGDWSTRDRWRFGWYD